MSRIIDILTAIQNGQTYTPEALSRVEAILKSICNNAGKNLVNIAAFTSDALLVGVDITDLKGKTISASSIIDNSSITGTGGRLRIDITDSGTTTNAFGNTVAGATSGISKIENITIPTTATKATLYFQSFSTSSGFSKFTKIMVNEGTTAAEYSEYYGEPQSRHEQLLIAIKNNQSVSGTPQTRVEEILFAIANGTEIPAVYQSELEEAYINAATNLKGV